MPRRWFYQNTTGFLPVAERSPVHGQSQPFARCLQGVGAVVNSEDTWSGLKGDTTVRCPFLPLVAVFFGADERMLDQVLDVVNRAIAVEVFGRTDGNDNFSAKLDEGFSRA